jgi:alpha-1,3-mannosyl-glycoprotein beta-1,2-N-acetylglucosaminyltransferase
MPGLGWYTTAAIGLELLKKWPLAYFDDWMRKMDVKNGRSCTYPEVSWISMQGSGGCLL